MVRVAKSSLSTSISVLDAPPCRLSPLFVILSVTGRRTTRSFGEQLTTLTPSSARSDHLPSPPSRISCTSLAASTRVGLGLGMADLVYAALHKTSELCAARPAARDYAAVRTVPANVLR